MRDWPDSFGGRSLPAVTALLFTVLAAGIGPGTPATAAEVDASDLARCAAIPAALSRLACYDALAARQSGPVRTPVIGTLPPSRAKPDDTPAEPAKPGASEPAPASLARGNEDAADDPSKFGLTSAQLHETRASGPATISAKVLSEASDRAAPGRVVIQLDNGQSWQLFEDDAGVGAGETVTIKRASMGSFLLLTPAHRSYRVRRIK